jgi:hypothetical protein
VLGALRPKPFRGDQVAAGVVVLSVLVALVGGRFFDAWAPETHLLYTVPAAAFVLAMAVLSPLEGPGPRPFQTVLYVAAFALSLHALGWLDAVLGGSGPATVPWVGAVLAAEQAYFAVARRSPTAALLAAISATAAVVGLVAWAAGDDLQTIRWALAAAVAVLGLAAIAQRDRRPGHAVQLANAAGLAALAVAVTELGTRLSVFDGETTAGTGAGWELLLLAAGFGLVSYGAVDRERGPAVLGVVDLVAFVLLASTSEDDPSLLGWPLLLAIAAAAFLIVGLRPTSPAPPPPDADRAGAPTLDLPPRGEPPI